MRRLIDRAAVVGAIAALMLSAVPLSAADGPVAKHGSRLTQLSVASRQLIAGASRTHAGSASAKDQSGGSTNGPGAFFKSPRGKVTLALMGAGAGFAVWSIRHDRGPVKSPVR